MGDAPSFDALDHAPPASPSPHQSLDNSSQLLSRLRYLLLWKIPYDTMDEYSDRVDGDDDAADNNNSVLSDTSTLDHDEDKEVSLLEYARYYDLCQDYTAFNPLDPIGLPSPSLSACLSSDDLSLPDLPPGFRTEERCTLDLGAATFLRSITSSQMDEDDSFYDYRRNDEFKVERPLLQTDAELDLKRFRGTRKADDEFDTTGFTNFETPEDDEQKLEWLDPKLPAMKDKEAQSEKLQLSKAAVDFLKDISSNAEMDLDDALLLTGESVERHVSYMHRIEQRKLY